MTGDVNHAVDLVSGHWRNQRGYAANEHGAFDAVGDYPPHATESADRPAGDRKEGPIHHPGNERTGAVERVVG